MAAVKIEKHPLIPFFPDKAKWLYERLTTL